jgi:hypothetical protein
MTPLLLRPATAADTPDLVRLAALDSTDPLEGEVLVAFAGGEIRAALSLETGRVAADPFWPSADLVELLRTAAGDGSRPRRRRARRLLARPIAA